MSTLTVRPVRTFKQRHGRVSARHLDALARLWPRFGAALPLESGDPHSLFGRNAPVVLEIGSGMGDATAAMATADPGRDYLAAEIHTPGVANLLSLLEDAGLLNVRVVQGDALELAVALVPGSLAAVHAFFPDPWPKARHHKRRLLQPAHVALLASRLAPGGVLHCATDCPAYAAEALATLAADPQLRIDGFVPRPAARPVTKFEQRALDAGRPIADLVATRIAPA